MNRSSRIHESRVAPATCLSTRAMLAVTAALVAHGTSGCSAADSGAAMGTEATGKSRAALTTSLGAGAVFGFEQLGAWSTNAGKLALSSAHVQGQRSLAISSIGSAQATLTSAPLSTLLGLGSTITFYIELPTNEPNPSWYGSVDVSLDAPSRGVNSAYIGHQELTGMPLGQFQVLSFNVPAATLAALQSGPYTDLKVRIALTVPAGSQTYLLDGLRFATAGVAAFDTPDGDGTPNDPNISAGPTLVGACDQNLMSFYTKAGVLDHQVDAHSLTTHDFGGDSKLVWDSQSQRWFYSSIAGVNTGGNHVDGVEFFVSTDATAQSWVESLPILDPFGQGLDNPNITVSSDKVIVGVGHNVWVVDKSALVKGGATQSQLVTTSLQNGDQLDGVQYGQFGGPSPSTAYFVAAGPDDSHIDWIAVDGTPAQNNVTVTEHVVAIPPLAPVTASLTQSDGVGLENGGTLATWAAGHLVWSRTEQCGSVTCARMFDIYAATGAMTSFDFGIPGQDVWSAVGSYDSTGILWTVMSAMVPGGIPGLAVGGRNASGTMYAPTVVVAGAAPFNGGRWGDYFGAAQDPSDGTVWLTGMYGGPSESTFSDSVIHVGSL